MLGIVLAAGAGRRLRPYTDSLPKALVPVDGSTTILDIVLHDLAAVDVRDIVVVVGYAAEAVRSRHEALEQRHGVRLTLLHNDRAETWNNAYSLWLARDHFEEGALVVNGDTVHPEAVEQTLLSAPRGDLVLAVDAHKVLGHEEMKVQVDAEVALTRITKEMDPAQAFGEYMGVTLVRPPVARPLAAALQATFERDPHLYYEDGYQELVDRGHRVDVALIPDDTRWVEVDNQDDLELARTIACHY